MHVERSEISLLTMQTQRIFLSFVNKADVFCDKADRLILP